MNFLDLNKVSLPLIRFSIVQSLRFLLKNALLYRISNPNDILQANRKYSFFWRIVMIKVSKVFGWISLVIAVFCVIVTVQFLIQGSSSGDWSSFGFYLIALIFIMASMLLTIPFLVMVFVVKYQRMKFHFYAHLGLIAMSIIAFTISLS